MAKHSWHEGWPSLFAVCKASAMPRENDTNSGSSFGLSAFGRADAMPEKRCGPSHPHFWTSLFTYVSCCLFVYLSRNTFMTTGHTYSSFCRGLAIQGREVFCHCPHWRRAKRLDQPTLLVISFVNFWIILHVDGRGRRWMGRIGLFRRASLICLLS